MIIHEPMTCRISGCVHDREIVRWVDDPRGDHGEEHIVQFREKKTGCVTERPLTMCEMIALGHAVGHSGSFPRPTDVIGKKVRVVMQQETVDHCWHVKRFLPMRRQRPSRERLLKRHGWTRSRPNGLTLGTIRQINNGPAIVGKRSDVLWKLINQCQEAGMTADETFIVLEPSPWNKFRDRRNGDEYLRRDIAKAY